MSEIVLSANQVSKTFQQGDDQLHILNGIDLNVKAGETVAVVGASGSGKTTLLQILGGLDLPDAGHIEWQGTPIDGHSDRRISQLRNQYLGFIYQLHHLLPELNALENVAMPLYIRGEDRKQAHERAKYCLHLVGLEQRMKHTPAKLSGGERQRVAIARAMVNEPACILADEPTGNLDTDNANQVMDQLMQMCEQTSVALVAITHDMQIAQRMDSVYRLVYGSLELEAHV